MIDEKLDRSQGGLQGSGSKFLCTLCHATRETARSHVGTFKITRTLEENVDIASYVQTNPDDLSQSDLASVAKGVKDYPILKSEPHHKLLDATHADINIGSFFKKLIICEVARTYTWEISRDVKAMFEDGEKRFNDHMRATLGLAPNLMMPGNYACHLFDPDNMSSVLSIIPDEERRNHLRDVMVLFTKLRTVYRAHHPRSADVAEYKANAIQMADLLQQGTLARRPGCRSRCFTSTLGRTSTRSSHDFRQFSSENVVNEMDAELNGAASLSKTVEPEPASPKHPN
nr:V(D)J recombination-activating protein 1-like [Lytechinus pictus]